MLTIENVDVNGWQASIRGMRNPLNSWDRSNSHYQTVIDDEGERQVFVVGSSDLDLMRRLCKAGPEHRKFMRMLVCTFDVVAPLYWLKEADTYKVGTVCNSCSTMHKISEHEFRFRDFSVDHLKANSLCILNETIGALNYYRDQYLATGDKEYWWQLIQLLPSSYNQRRTYQMDYETLLSIVRQRRGHKLDEWRVFVNEVITKLPYFSEITGEVVR